MKLRNIFDELVEGFDDLAGKVTIKLSKMQADEVAHKLDIVSMEDDLLDSYEVTADEVTTLHDIFAKGSGSFTFEKKYAELVQGELENSLEIADDNAQVDPDWRGVVTSLKQAIKKLKAIS